MLHALADRDPDAHRDDEIVASDVKRIAQGALDALRYLGRFLGRSDAVQQDRELVAPDPGDRVARAQMGCEATRQGNQKRVTSGMAEAVVHELEAVKVEEEHRAPVVVGHARRASATPRGDPGRACGWEGR